MVNFCTEDIGPFDLFEVIKATEKIKLIDPFFLEVSDGLSLAYYPFCDSTVESIVLLLPGAGMYANEVYQFVAKNLFERYKIGCFVLDMRGHGNSEGKRGDASSIERLFKDLYEFIIFFKKLYPEKKIFLAGHSSGAGFLMNYAASEIYPKDESGYISEAPYLGPQSNTFYDYSNNHKNFVKKTRPLIYVLGSIFPSSFFTHYKSVFFNYSKDLLKKFPLIVDSYTYMMSMATTPYEIETILKKINRSVFVCIGKDDEQFIPEKIINLMQKINTLEKCEIIKNKGHISILLDVPSFIFESISK
jgi:pimeloyl-ACP methyl ester carboxylesterase